MLAFLLFLATPGLADDPPPFDPYRYWDYSHGALAYNATYDANRILCVYPLSGQYSLLNRLLYYALIVFAVVGHSHPWLVTGPLAYIMTYSSTAAVHALIMAVVSENSLLDIDVLGTWAIISIGCLAVLPIFTTSKAISESQYSPVFGFWGTLMSIGVICSLVSIHREYPDELECRSSTNMQLLTSQAQLLDDTFNCSYTCFGSSQPLRATSEIAIISKKAIFGHFSILQAALGLTGAFGLISALFGCIPMHRKSTEAELRATIRHNQPSKRYETSKVARSKRSARKHAREELNRGEYKPGAMTMCWTILAVPSVAIVIVLNEVFILAHDGGFQSSEKPYAIGQWGPWVSVFLAAIAAWMVKFYTPGWKARQKILAEEREAFKLRNGIEEQGNTDAKNESSKRLPARSVDDIEAGLKTLESPIIAAAQNGYMAASSNNVSNCSDNVGTAGVDVIALGTSSANGHTDAILRLLDSGVDVNEKDRFGLTALIRASWAGHESVVKLLLERGAIASGWQGTMAVTRASQNHHFNIVQMLLDHGASRGIYTHDLRNDIF
ncbi:hypothetical protein V502_05822 [Pseudogymnoascus sp. VKM F-4520 (FW-2644)]|nr:hypothetical protein V502_05822 [Pseudogymnoascus sp. VKM F-4520 (FW-2644)]